MDIKIAKNELLRGLELARGIASKEKTIPILSHTLLRAVGKTKLLLAATDLRVSVSAELACTASREGGIAIGTKALFATVASASGDEISLKTTDGNWLEIKSGKAKWRLAGLADRDYPKIASPAGIDAMAVDAEALRVLIDRTEFAASKDDSRAMICGINLVSDGVTCTASAADGHRVARARSAAVFPRTPSATIPTASALEIRHLIDKATTCMVALKAPDLFVTVDGITVACKLIDLQFPNVDRVFDLVTTSKVSLVANRDAMIEALRRVAPMTTDVKGMRMEVGAGRVALSAKVEGGEASDEVSAETKGEIVIGFYPKYLLAILDHMSSDQVRFSFGGEFDPAIITPLDDDTYTCIVMPMRLT